jgi:hypothetical protein
MAGQEDRGRGKRDPDATFHLSLDKAERCFRVISDSFRNMSYAVRKIIGEHLPTVKQFVSDDYKR